MFPFDVLITLIVVGVVSESNTYPSGFNSDPDPSVVADEAAVPLQFTYTFTSALRITLEALDGTVIEAALLAVNEYLFM